ncbi:MAG TPA: ABC transporter permease [Candidatus Ventrousia excrementavium]|uniref:ABC transporter permease n=1 Tax=Candidatus Ventrousia excrementavium TaxID=2840961 RepID=A0A9D1LML0_9CLOT|nr:ABC transporter permease [Candidatus Ventrousia excrementavium]
MQSKQEKIQAAERAMGQKSRSYYVDALMRLRKNRSAMVCLFVIVVFIIVAFTAQWISPYDPYEIDLKNMLEGPSAEHWMGTDEYGRDIFSRILYGTRISLSVGLVSQIISTVLGVVLGSIAGYYGGKIDMLISRLMEVFSAFPDILFAIGIMFVLGQGILNIFIALGILGWVSTARLVRSQVLQLKETEYIAAAKSAGATSFWLITRHMIPNCVSTIIILITMGIPGAIMSEASLSFLGLGVSPPTASWGSMINTARIYILSDPTYSIFPGIAIIILVLAFNIFGDGLRDALDPRLKD